MDNLPLFARGPKIFEIWKKTLLFWLSFRRHVVFLVTPFLDEDILKEFLDIVKTKRETAKLGWFFVREECHETLVIENGKKTKKIVHFKEIWENSTRHYDKEDKKFFDEKVFPLFIAIKKETNYFHGKLIGCVNRKTDKAEVLQTSANFNEIHFRIWKNGKCNHDSLGYHRMSKKKFKKNLLRPMEKLQKKKKTNKISYRTTQR